MSVLHSTTSCTMPSSTVHIGAMIHGRGSARRQTHIQESKTSLSPHHSRMPHFSFLPSCSLYPLHVSLNKKNHPIDNVLCYLLRNNKILSSKDKRCHLSLGATSTVGVFHPRN